MNRKSIQKKVNSINAKIEALSIQKTELIRQAILLSDKNQQYKEEEETFGKGNNKETHLIGRIYWREFFTDEDYQNDPKKGVWITRSRIVKQDGEFVNGY